MAARDASRTAREATPPHVRWDVAVAGLGPAGAALVHRLLRRGLSVLAVDPRPGAPWRQTLGGWTRQLPSWLPADVVGATASDPVIRAGATYPIPQQYAVLDNAALARALDLGGAVVETRGVGDAELADLPARVVIDARGSRPGDSHRRDDRARPARVPLQRAFGVLVDPEVAAPVLGGASAVLMDWRPVDGAPSWGATPPTFLYAIPMPDGRLLLEETCLAGVPGPDHADLRERLRHRLNRSGLPASTVDEAAARSDAEYVSIPMVRAPRPRGGPLRFGAAGAQHNPITGYSFFASLRAVDDVVDAVAVAVRDGGRPRVPDRPPVVRQAALRALLRLSPDDTLALFDAFGRLPADRQWAVLDAKATTPDLLAGLTTQFTRLPPRSAVGLLRATTF